jgi:hypothetical protein
MSDINIHGVPLAPGGYSLTDKKIMVHDLTAPLSTSTVLFSADEFGGDSYRAPMWKESDGDMTPGLTTFVHTSLIGATQINFIIVNKAIEFIDEDYTFNIATGEIDRSPNQWQVGDKMITPYKPA